MTKTNSVGITGFEVLNISNALTGTVTLANTQAALAANLTAGGTGTIVGSAGTQAISTSAALTGALTLTDTGVGTTDTVSISNSKPVTGLNWGNGNNIISSGYETVNISSNGAGTATTLTLGAVTVGADTIAGGAAANGVSAVNFTGSNIVTVGAITASAISASGLTTPSATGVTTFSMTAPAVGVKTITGSAGNDVLVGDASSTIVGGDGDDSITGGSGIDTLQGGAGKDTITTNGGNDTVTGGAGNDTIVLGGNLSALDSISGGDGTDTLSMSSASIDALKLLTLTEANVFNGNLSSVETLTVTGALNSTTFDLGYLNGITTINLANGVNGTEALTGLVSGSTVTTAVALSNVLTLGVTGSKAGTTEALTVKLTESGNTDYTSIAVLDVETLTIDATESTASAANTRAFRIGIDNTATAATAAAGGSGASQTVNIIGSESLRVDTAIAADVINASGMGARLTTTAGLTMDAGFTATVAMPGQTITGSGGVDILKSSTGADTVVGGAGNDVIHGSIGGDNNDGGAGSDTYATVAAQVGANIEGAGTGQSSGLVINLSAATLTNSNVLSVGGQNLAGTLTGVASGTAAYQFGGAANTNSAKVITLTSIENVQLNGNGANYVVGSKAANTILGGTLVDTILAGDGNDTITGGDAIDILTGGKGNDKYVYTVDIDLFTTSNIIEDTITEASTTGSGNDSIVIDANISTFTIVVGDDFGAKAVNIESITAVPSANVITLTFKADMVADAAALTTIDLSGDTDATSNNVVSLAAILSGAYTLTGSAGIDTITGSTGIDTITGGEGADVITGGPGNDIIVLTETTAAADDVVFQAIATNGIDQISGFDSTDTFRVVALGDGSTGAGITAVTAAGTAAALTNDRSVIISANGTAANLTTSGTATVATADFTAGTLTAVAAYLDERYTVIATNQNGVIVFNDTTAGQNKTYVYNLNEVGGNITIDAGDITLVGVIANGGTDLVNANIDYA